MSEQKLREFQDQIDKIYDALIEDDSCPGDPGGHVAGAVSNLDRAIGSLEEAIYRTNKESGND